MPKRPLWQVGILTAGLLAAAEVTRRANLDDPEKMRTVRWPTFTALAVILLCAAIVRFGQNGFRRAVIALRRSSPTIAKPKSPCARGWFVLGLAVLAGVIVFLEIRQPRYFLQDDSLVGWQPGVVAGMDTLASGHWPQWQAQQLMGQPLAALGSGAFTYPPTYVAYGMARGILHDKADFCDVFCIFHILGGYALTFLACRRVGMAGPLATAGALALAISGYALIAGRSWSGVALTPALFGPLLALSLISLANGRSSLRWIICTGFTIGIFYQVGFPQIWVYGMICFTLAVLTLALSRAISDRELLRAATAVLLGIGLSLPLIVMQWSVAGDVVRISTNGAGIERGLASMILPWPFVRNLDPQELVTAHKQLAGQVYYSGTLFSVVGLLAVGSLLVLHWNRLALRRNVWIILAAATFLLALGRAGGVHLLLLNAPLIGKNLNYPFRVLPYLHLFMILGAGVILQRGLRRMRRPALERGVALAAIVLTVYGAILCKPAFYYYGFDAYPPLPAGLVAAMNSGEAWQRQQRIIPAGPWFSQRSDWWELMSQALATHYGFNSFDGYNPAVEDSVMRREIVARMGADASYPFYNADAAIAQPPHAYDRIKRDLQALGVRWVIALDPAGDAHTHPGPDPGLEREKYGGLRDAVAGRMSIGAHQFSVPGIGIKRWQDGEISLYEIPEALPMAFAEDAPQVPLPVTIRDDGVDVDVSSVAGTPRIVLNFTAWPNWEVRAAGQPLQIEPDDTPVRLNRIIVRLPVSARRIEARYEPPMATGLICGAAVVAAALALGSALRDRELRVINHN